MTTGGIMAKRNRNQNRPQKVARLLVVDDHPMVRERLTEVVNSEADLRVCGEAKDAQEALRVIAATDPDLVLVDLNMGGCAGLDLIKDISVRHPKVLMLVVSIHDESTYAERALRAGAHGYISKQKATTAVLEAIRKVLAGEVYMSQELAAQIACKVTGHHRQAAMRVDALSDRELRVFELIGQGYRMREIAEMLHLDVKTVETYRSRIEEKLELKDANEVLKQAIRWSRNVAPS